MLARLLFHGADGRKYAKIPRMNINRINPATLKITDMRFADIDGAPKRCTLLKLYTNQGIVGYGEVRDASSRTYAAMLKSRILGENPCNVEKVFRRIKQFGGDSRQAGGVCAVELACWDICGKAWGVPVWQLLGGKWRDEIRCYCDTDSEGGGRDMGQALKARMEMGFTFLKMDLGIELLMNVKDALIAPLGYLDYMKKMKHVVQTPHGSIDPRSMRGEAFELFTTAHGHTGIHITEKGLDYLEKYMADVREVIGWEIPIAIDHLGHIPYEDCVQLLRRLEKYHLSWAEDVLPWRAAPRRHHHAARHGRGHLPQGGLQAASGIRRAGRDPSRPADGGRHRRDEEGRRHGRGLRRADEPPHGRVAHRLPRGGARGGGHAQLHGARAAFRGRALVGRPRQARALVCGRIHQGAVEARPRHRRAEREAHQEAGVRRVPAAVGADEGMGQGVVQRPPVELIERKAHDKGKV